MRPPNKAVSGLRHQAARLSRGTRRDPAEIDRLVFELYGLTAEEIAIVEGKR